MIPVLAKRASGIRSGIAAALVALLSACGTGSPPADDSVTIRLTDFFPTGHYAAENAVTPFMERVEALSGGEIEFEYYPSEQLVAGADSVTAAETGLSDISYFTMPYSGHDLPLLSVCSLPNAFETATQGIRACNAAIETAPVQQTFDELNVHYLWGFTMPPYTIQTVDRKLTSVEDIRGLKIQSSGGVYSDTLAAVGAVPVEMTGGETYEALDRGTIDGTNLNLFSLDGYGITPQLEFSPKGINAGSLLSGFLINEETWTKLSPEHRGVLERASSELEAAFSTWLDANLPRTEKELAKDGITFTEFSANEATRWDALVQPVWDEWVPEMESRGLDGQTVMDAWNAGLERAAPRP